MDDIASFWVSPSGEFWVRLKDGGTRPASNQDVRQIHDLDPSGRAPAVSGAPAPQSNG